MAETVVSFAVERLGELLISEIKHLHGVSDKVKEIQRELKRMQCFLKEADKKQNQDERVKNWVAEMRELAFRIEDVIETFAIEVPTKIQNSGFKKMLRRFACMLSEGVSRRNISSEIDAIKDEMANLRTSLPSYGITKGLQEGEISNPTSNKRVFYSHIIEKDFVGMEKELKLVISSLKKQDRGCEVVSICGMGGQGKTTLAQKLYNYCEVKAHFQKLAWVCVTQQFDREKVLKEALKQLIPDARKQEVTNMDNGELVGELYQVQIEYNCLVVLDDIWTIDSWRLLKDAFPVGETASGSKILVTTRNETVAGIGLVHRIEGLTTEEGWQLLSKKAGISHIFSDEILASRMEILGKSMVEKCKHLPLAISSIGGILNGKLLRDWETINKDISFYLLQSEGSVSKDDEYYTVRQVLGLSYDSLPPHLRHCFLCFANFNEDEVIKTEKLYILWMAEGLISVEHKSERKMLLEIAESFMDELAHRSLVQVKKRKNEGKSWSKYKTCSVHDLIRDFCLSKAMEENFIKVVHSQLPSEDELRASIARRLCINSYNESMLRTCDKDMISHVRSLFIVKGFPGSVKDYFLWPDEILSLQKFKLLRILTVKQFELTKQDMKMISELVYLKCLSLHQCKVEELPSWIGNLRNLEILDLAGSQAGKMANVLWKLKRLKYLHLPQMFQVEKLRFEGLDELEVIHKFDSDYCDLSDLIGLSKLKVLSAILSTKTDIVSGKSVLDFIESRELRHSEIFIGSEDEFCLKSWLECFFINILVMYGPICRFPKEYDTTSLSSSCLSYLMLSGCGMEEDPMIFLEKLPNLRKLGLNRDAYLGTEMACTAKGFPKLQVLYMYSLKGLKQWRVEEGAMPNLSFLEIDCCVELEMLPEGLRCLAALESLRIRNMPGAFIERIYGVGEAEGVDMYKVSHVLNIEVF
ncbi:putative disease resistance protein At1g50180 [Apium graveolens]|uniref:putative disease resistance protein At1g50180 n=1 Tax=Apium graveolens TaxID=4045 RepID=UPI003D7A5E60